MKQLLFPLPLSALIFLVSSSFAEPADTPASDAAPDTTAAAAPAESADDTGPLDFDDLYEAGKQLFDEYASEEIKKDYEFPSHENWDAFANRLQQALQGGSLEELAAFEPEVRRALAAFRILPDYTDYVDWLTERLDLIETARTAVAAQKKRLPRPPAPKPGEVEPTPIPVPAAVAALPYYDVWVQRLKDRPLPPRANELLPLLKVIFEAEGIPSELAWLAEVESSLNPSARSPVGARGLFQLMPATAKALGLSLRPIDERTQPGKNARAAARLLHRLHTRFEGWPLALAAYNAGEGRIAVALKKNRASTFAEIADALPVETRMYVPKVFATMNVRENTAPETLLPAPKVALAGP